MQKSKILIVDGNSLAYRAFYAYPPLSNSQGEFTNVIFGFLNMFLLAVQKFNPTNVVVCFDYAKETFRSELCKDYKATRKPMPDEMRSQMPVLENLLKLMNVKILKQKGYEADDLIGSTVKTFNDDLVEKILISGDKDLLQLINDSTKVCLTKKGLTELKEYDEEAFTSEYGFKPINIIDLKAIMGDSSDNIKGVSGIGEKGATNLIAKYTTVESIYENINEITGKQKEHLISGKESAELSKKLATIFCDVDLKLNLTDCDFKIPFKKEVVEELRRLDIKAILKKEEFFGKDVYLTETVSVKSNNDEIKNEFRIENLEVLKTFVKEFKPETISMLITNVAITIFDGETNIKILLMQESFNQSVMPGFEADEFNRKSGIGMGLNECLIALKPIMENKKIAKIFWDYKEILKMYASYKINCEVKGKVDDIKLQFWLKSLELVCPKTSEELFKVNDSSLGKIYDEIEIPLVQVLFSMESSGVKIDEQVLSELTAKYTKEQNEVAKEIFNISESEFNLNSPKQLSEVLFKKMGLNPHLKEPNTSFETLYKMRFQHKIIEKVLEYREISKLVSTYLNAFSEILLKNKDGFIYTTFNQTGTITGRLSSEKPNLQNIPVRSEKGKELRKVFISRFLGGKIISADYNQIELRLSAILSGDEKMLDAYKNGVDIHMLTASQIFNVDLKTVTKEMRQRAKSVNFGILYGISAFGLSEQIGISPKEAAEYIDRYYKKFSKIKTYMEGNIDKALKNGGYVETIMGRKRRIPELFSTNYNIANFGKRAAMNTPIQGSSGDIIKLAMVNILKKLKECNLKSKLILQIHDELIIDTHPDEIDIVKQILKTEMEGVMKLAIPLSADVEVGDNWYLV